MSEILEAISQLSHIEQIKIAHIIITNNTKSDDLEGFSALANKSFEFWNDPSEDIYQEFYTQKGLL